MPTIGLDKVYYAKLQKTLMVMKVMEYQFT